MEGSIKNTGLKANRSLDDYTLGQVMCSIQSMALRVDQSNNCYFADESVLMPIAGLDQKVLQNSSISEILGEEILQRVPANIDLARLQDPYELEIEIVPRPAVSVFIRARIVPIKNQQGDADGFVIFCYDVTAQKITELALERKTSSLELLLSCTNMANRASEFKLALSDCMEVICSYENWLYKGWLVAHAYLVDEEDPDMLVSSNIWHCKDIESIQPFVDLTMQTPLRRGLGIAGQVLESGKPIWHGKKSSYPKLPRAKLADECGLYSLVAIPIVTGDSIVAVIELFADDERPPNEQMLNVLVAIGRELGSVYNREKATQQIRFMADHDSLTGLVVTRVVRDRINRTLAEIARYPAIAAVLFIDLDGFKLVNDAYGHDAGDELLVHASRVLSESVREVDTVCRFGGDEFIILLTSLSSEAGAVTVAEKILNAFKIPVKVGDSELRVGVSIGIAICRNSRQTVDSLIKTADSAMYKAKNSGKNRLVLHD